MVKFVVVQEHFFWWPVKVRMPNPDPRRAGQFEEFSFKVQFEAIGSAEADGIIAEVNELPPAERAAGQHDLLLRMVRDWNEDIVDEEGEPVPFEQATLRALLDNAWFAVGLWRAWGEAQRDEGGRRKN